MGMSASQARFLCLTARKNNVEFEGQQINQQRTTLSNESASYYSELCNMEVPTPPSVDDYTKVSYTFNDGAMTNTIISMLAKGNNEYSISYLEQWQDDYSIVAAASSLVARSGNDTSGFKYSIGNSNLRPLMEFSDNQTTTTETKTTFNGKTVFTDGTGPYIVVPTSNPVNPNSPTQTNSGDYKFFPKDASGNAHTTNPLVLINGQYYPFSHVDNDGITLLPGAQAVTVSDINNYLVSNGDIDTNGNVVYYTYEQYQTDVLGQTTDSDGKHYLTQEEKDMVQTTTETKTVFTDLKDPYLLTLNEDQLQDLLETEKYYRQMLKEKFGDDSEWFVRYIKNTTSGIYEPYFYKKQELEDGSRYHGNDTQLAHISCFSLGSTTKTKEVLNERGLVEKDSSGRYVAITLFDKDNNPTTYTLTTTTSTDEEAYNDAMQQYHFEQHVYDHKVQEINSKLEIIQAQDKQLELKLKQLDTEENAISTEMDAVKKVISKNVESSFKTFNA